MAEPIEMQFRMLSQMGRVQGTRITCWCRCPHWNGHFLGCLADL